MGLSVYLYECDPSSFNLPINGKNYVAVTITDQIVVKQALKWALGELYNPSGSESGERPNKTCEELGVRIITYLWIKQDTL